MKRFLFFYAALWAFSPLSAQDTYHQFLIDDLELNFGVELTGWGLIPDHQAIISDLNYYGVTGEVTAVADTLLFEEALSIEIEQEGASPWSSGVLISNQNPLTQGTVCLLTAWIKAESPVRINWFAEHSTTYEKEVYINISLDAAEEWYQLYLPFVLSADYAPGMLNMGFHTGLQTQELELAGINIARIEAGTSVGDLPHQLHNENYPGSAVDAPWRAEAAARIEAHRKASLSVEVVDANGLPVPNADVEFTMQEHAFGFGSAVVTCMVNASGCFNETYQERLLDLDGQGHRFNCLVNENSLKWPGWENNWLGTPQQTVSSLAWLKDQGFKLRGHNVVWPGFSHMPADIANNADNPDYVRNRIFEHIDEKVGYPGLSDLISDWDVLNEITANRDLEYLFQDTEGYTTGREIYPEIIDHVVQVDPGSKLYLNDYVTLSSATTRGEVYERYQQFIQEILDAGAPLDGIGFQAHMGSGLYHPDTLFTILEDFHTKFGLRAKITEFDQSPVLSETLAAQYFRDFLTITFSHPSVDAFLMWGFWDGAHWLDNAPLFRQDWTPKPALDTFINLVYNDWWTEESTVTDASGMAGIRGFKGTYRITVTAGEVSVDTTIHMENDYQWQLQLPMTSSVHSIDPASIQVAPNPATHQITVRWDALQTEGTLRISDGQGRTLVQQPLKGTSQVINTRQWPAGIYWLQISTPVESVTLPVMIERR